MGGTSAQFKFGAGFGHSMHETYLLRPDRPVVLEDDRSGSRKFTIVQSAGLVQLRFRRVGMPSSREDIIALSGDSDRLEWACFCVDRRTVAEMADSR